MTTNTDAVADLTAPTAEELERLQCYRHSRGTLRREWGDRGLCVLWHYAQGNGVAMHEYLSYARGGHTLYADLRRLGLDLRGNDHRVNAVQPQTYSGPSVTPGEAYATLVHPGSPASSLSPLAAQVLIYLQKHREAVHSPEALAAQFGWGVEYVALALAELRAAHYDVAEMGDGPQAGVVLAPPIHTTFEAPVTLPGWDTSEIVVGVVSDTHDGSQYQATEELETTYDRFVAAGITEVLHAGDLIGGPGMVGYQGHLWETIHECEGPEGSVDHAVRCYPERPGITTRFVQGSHDDWWRRKHGRDLLKEVCARRSDMVCLGRDTAHLRIGPEDQTRVMLMHPDMGKSYAISYKPQQFVQGLLGGTKPHLLIIGHYHSAGWFPIRNIETLLAGCFEWQTPFLAKKGITPVVGAYILHMVLDPDGWIREFESRFLPYYYPEAN